MLADAVTVVVAAVFLLTVLLPALAVGYLFARYANLFARVGTLTRPLGFDRWAGFGAMLVFFTGFAWLAAVGEIPDEGERFWLPANLAVLGFGVGLFCVALALSNLRRYRRLRDGEFVAGVAEAGGGETVSAPLSGESCLAWAIRVSEHSGFFRRGGPPAIRHDSGGTTFVVQSDTERIRVNPSAATFDVWSVGGRSSPDFVARERDGVSERVTEYANDAGLDDPDRSRGYSEVRIEPGDTVTVFGSTDGRMAVGGPGTVLADRSGETVRRQIRRRVRAGPAGVALALVSFGVAALLSGAI
ncbi:hypothetical protein [Halosimplex salinum]|uniref:hypothetical protein n=1 Tax=Halosimplex salinum TaxID=1710538 RepID=UPI000F479949|nr:hypothetical protein [Halosimplex salinum]